MRFFESLAIGVAMYSKIPMPRVEWNEKNMKYKRKKSDKMPVDDLVKAS